MQITVYGASGHVGRMVVQTLLGRGHSVVAFVHTASLPSSERLTLYKGDISDRSAVEAALSIGGGSQAVVSTLGSWHSQQKNILTTAMERVVPAMEARGISRIVSLTGNVASAPGDSKSLTRFLSIAGFNMIAPKILRDGDDHLALLAASSLDWTVIRSSVMLKSGGPTYRLDAAHGSLAIPRRAVATAICDLVESADWIRQAPFIARA